MNFDATEQQIIDALGVLDGLERTSGSRRNERIKLLSSQQQNPVLKLLLQVGCDQLIDPIIESVGLWPVSPIEEGLKQPQLVSLRQFHELIFSSHERKKGIVVRRRKFAALLAGTDPQLARWFFRSVAKDLQIGVGVGLLHQVFGNGFCPHIKVPPAMMPATEGIRLFFFLGDAVCICLTSELRDFPIAVDAFGLQLLRVCGEASVVEAILTSNDWPLTSSLLFSKTKSLQRKCYQSLYYGMKLKLVRGWRWQAFWNLPQTDDAALVTEIHNKIKERNPRTSIDLPKFSNGPHNSNSLGATNETNAPTA